MRQMRRSSRARAPAALGSARGSLLDRGCLPFTSPFLCFLRWAPGCSAKHPSKVAVVRSNSHQTPPCECHRSEEHTSELQSLRHLVCRLLLEKKKKIQKYTLLLFVCTQLHLLLIS